LTADEFAALREIDGAPRGTKPSARVGRNAKRLSGLKYAAYGKDGMLALTEKGRLTLFIGRCIEGLRAVAADPFAPLDASVVAFLEKKGHIAAAPSSGGATAYAITAKGRETLADIDAA